MRQVTGAVEFRAKIEKSLLRLERWIEERDYKGYDPGDGLNSFLRPLAMKNELLERILLQLVWKAPINIRPLIGIKPMDSTKGRGYMVAGYLLMKNTRGDASYLHKSENCLRWLEDNQTAKSGYAWGNHFDFRTRSGLNPAGSPIIVWTSLIGHAFLDFYEETHDTRCLDAARKVCAWVMALPREVTSEGTCLSYVPFKQSSIHNSNMLGASILARTSMHNGDNAMSQIARDAVHYTCHRQLKDGAWWYGEEPKYHWIDSFHTGYNLDSLLTYSESTGDSTYRANLDAGLRYFADHFFLHDGTPKYYHDRTQPIDIQCAAQAIETLAKCSSGADEFLNLSCRVADWTIDHMQDETGYFYYRKYPVLTAKTPYIHWGQATMYKGLATLLSKLPTESA